MVADPEMLGTHRKTFSGAAVLLPQVPASVPEPAVEPVKTPPDAGIVTALLHGVDVVGHDPESVYNEVVL